MRGRWLPTGGGVTQIRDASQETITPSDAFARGLLRAEDRLRAHGLTGAQAFDALLPAIEERLGVTGRQQVLMPAFVREAAEALPRPAGEIDLLGLAYERFFADLFKGLRGQFFTPPPIGRLLVAGLDLAPGQRVIDPTCGSGGLLVLAARAGARVAGVEIDRRLARLAALNLALVGAHEPEAVRPADFFGVEPPEEPFDALIANPPFSVDIDDRWVLDRYEMGRGKARVLSDRLFVEAIEQWVVPGGRAGVVMPHSVLANPSWQDVRDRIDAGWIRTRTCTLPEGVFRPFGGAAGRAVLLWLERRSRRRQRVQAEVLWGTLADPGYDVRNKRLRPTSSVEVDARCAGVGFEPLPAGAWVPAGTGRGVPVRDVARLRRERGPPSEWVADLAHADRVTGELHPEARPAGPGAEPSARQRLAPGDVVVAQLRPNLGNVAAVPPADGGVVGSPEWIALEPMRHGGWLLHALRTPAWRGALPIPHGQTRPRVSPEAVLDSPVPWPDEALAARVDALSVRLRDERRLLRERLVALQGAVDRFAAEELDEEGLEAEVRRLESP
jgi:protein-L-isoaspartate O-methyltransferase